MAKKVKLIIFLFILCAGAFYLWHWQKERLEKMFYENYPKGVIRVELLNGTNISDLAYTLTKIMRTEGFDVAEFGNAPSMKYPKTLIIDRTGKEEEKIRILKAYFGTEEAFVLYDDRREMEKIDATIIIGEDILQTDIFKNHKSLMEGY